MSDTLTYTDVLSIIDCGVCHISFAIPEGMLRNRKQDGEWFWCPRGCKIHYGTFENAKLKQEKAELERRLAYQRTATQAARDQADAAERRRRAAKGQLTKTRNRIANGVCPCCNRTFANLADHMATKHPTFTEPTP